MKVRASSLYSLLVVMLFAANASAQLPPPSWGSQTGMNLVRRADLTHAGRQDLIGVGSAGITALLNDGTGKFPTVKTTPISGILTSSGNMVVGDLNKDGFPDVVMPGADPITGVAAIAIMLGNGDGSFTTLKVMDLPGAGSELVTGNFTGHGNVDLAIVNYNGGQASTFVLPGHGDGTFGAAIVTAIPMSSSCAAAADFNNDGKLDLGLGGAVVALGNGDGTFQAPFGGTTGVCSQGIADLNHDGILDVVTPGVTVQFGDGTGHFGVAKTYPVTDGGSNLGVADFTGDGFPDIAVITTVDDITILLNNRDGTFKTAGTYDGGQYEVLPGDFDGDGKQDLVFSGGTLTGNTGFSFIKGRGDGTFLAAKAQNDQHDGNLNIIAADFNNDRKMDLLAYGGSADVQLGNGNGTFQTPVLLPSSCTTGVSSIAIGDFNHDHFPDIATITSTAGGVNVCLGNGDGTFQTAQVYDQGIPHQSVVVGDFNNDGNLDLAVSDLGGVSILLGNGDGTFQGGIPNAVGHYPIFFAGDFNGDGKLDIVTSLSQSSIAVLFGNGNGTLQAPVFSQGDGNILAVGDLNDDSKLDLVVNYFNSGGLVTQLGNGDGTFQAPLPSYNDRVGNALLLTDYDKDGKLDLASVQTSSVQVMRGDGNGIFELPLATIPGNNGSVGAAVGDYSGDGFPDLAMLTHGTADGKLIVYINPR